MIPGITPPPNGVSDLAEGCIRFVERSLGIKLDYQPETLPVLDHYLEQARKEARDRPEVLAVTAHTTGAYLGEVVRRRHASWWRVEGDDPAEWQLEFESVFLSFSPVRLTLAVLLRSATTLHDESPGTTDVLDAPDVDEMANFVLEEEDRKAVSARLAELPPVSEEEFYAPSTRIEVIDIAIEAIRARRIAEGEPADAKLRPEDYEHGD